MVAWRYEISLLVLKTIHSFARQPKRNFVSPRGHVISSIYQILSTSFSRKCMESLYVDIGLKGLNNRLSNQ